MSPADCVRISGFWGFATDPLWDSAPPTSWGNSVPRPSVPTIPPNLGYASGERLKNDEDKSSADVNAGTDDIKFPSLLKTDPPTLAEQLLRCVLVEKC